MAVNRRHLVVDNLERSYRLHVPPNQEYGNALPLVIVLHGHGGSADHTAKHFGWIEEADKEGFFVVLPEGAPLHKNIPVHYMHNPRTWHNPHVDNIKFIREMIQNISENYLVDGKRIYCTGFSSGAWMSFNLGIHLADKIAAIGPVCGYNSDIKSQQMSRPVSMMLVVGDEDPIMPVNGGEAKSSPWSDKKINKTPIIDVVDKWLDLINVSKNGVAKQEDGALITHFGPGDRGQEVFYAIVKGNGHEWPGVKQVLPVEQVGHNIQTFKTTSRLWRFFTTKSL